MTVEVASLILLWLMRIQSITGGMGQENYNSFSSDCNGNKGPSPGMFTIFTISGDEKFYSRGSRELFLF